MYVTDNNKSSNNLYWDALQQSSTGPEAQRNCVE